MWYTRSTSYLKSNNKAKSDSKKFPVKQCVFSIDVSEIFVSKIHQRKIVVINFSTPNPQTQIFSDDISYVI